MEIGAEELIQGLSWTHRETGVKNQTLTTLSLGATKPSLYNYVAPSKLQIKKNTYFYLLIFWKTTSIMTCYLQYVCDVRYYGKNRALDQKALYSTFQNYQWSIEAHSPKSPLSWIFYLCTTWVCQTVLYA